MKETQIHLASPKECTGCNACVSVCPKQCISMQEDREGFLQPEIDVKLCISCHKCEKTCPIITPLTIAGDFETQAYAAINKDEEIRMQSSSGGLFYALAKWTIEQGGVVFGVKFNKQWEVVHDYTETLDGIKPFMRSKYVQSRVGDSFKYVKEFLEKGRNVLYSGTPCQIGGLKAYLGKDYDKLITMDLICHGVPSPGIWRAYLKESYQNEVLLDYNFRDKRDGWLNSQCVTSITSKGVIREKKKSNLFYNGFLGDFYLRRSCYNCLFKTIQRNSDITLADCWGIQQILPELFDDKGASLLLTHSMIGNDIIERICDDIIVYQTNLRDILLFNKRAVLSVDKKITRSLFFIFNNFLDFKKSILLALMIDKYVAKIVKIKKKILKFIR